MLTLGAIRFDIIVDYGPMFLKGALLTLELTVVAVSVGTFFGLFLSLLTLSSFKPAYWFGKVYVDLFRGTPLLVQIFIFHYAVLPAIGDFPTIVSGFVALSLNSGAYIAEIFRAGIQSIDRGQMEASRSLGMTYAQAMRHIIIPQAFKRVIPPLGNEFIAMLKDSSLVSAIALQELAMTGTIVMGTTTRVWESLLPVAVLYLVMTLLLSQLVYYLERRLGKSDIRA
jgi:glutamine transport system permease protein